MLIVVKLNLYSFKNDIMYTIHLSKTLIYITPDNDDYDLISLEDYVQLTKNIIYVHDFIAWKSSYIMYTSIIVKFIVDRSL